MNIAGTTYGLTYKGGALTLATQSIVTIQGAQGNTNTRNPSIVSVAITGGNGASQTGTTRSRAVVGIASFAGLGLNGAPKIVGKKQGKKPKK
jgi:hypothetical protein